MLDSMSARTRNFRIVASDIDEGALRVARAGGPYNKDDIKNIPPELLKNYVISDENDFRVTEKIKKKIEFRQQNLLMDEFEKDFDLIVCRNVTIYFTDKAKKDLNTKFFNSLKPGGVLFIGGTEVMLDATAISFENLGVSFYRRPVLNVSPAQKPVEKVMA